MYVPEDNLIFRKLGLTRSISAELSMTSKEFIEMFKSKVDQADYIFEFFAVREKGYGGSITNSTFEILHGGTGITGVSGSYHEAGDKLNVQVLVYCHMIHAFLFLFISYLIGFVTMYNYGLSQELDLLLIYSISFILFPAWILYNFKKKAKTAVVDFEKSFLNRQFKGQ